MVDASLIRCVVEFINILSLGVGSLFVRYFSNVNQWIIFLLTVRRFKNLSIAHPRPTITLFLALNFGSGVLNPARIKLNFEFYSWSRVSNLGLNLKLKTKLHSWS